MDIETTMLYKLRFKQQATIVATEVYSNGPAGIADILAIKKGKVYEYEIKRSKSDFRADFKKSAHGINKHMWYCNQEELFTKHNKWASWRTAMRFFVPDYFYFVVPKELGEYALSYLKDHNYTKYGVITISEKFKDSVIHPSNTINRAKKLEACYKIDKISDRIIGRMGSGMVNCQMKLYRRMLRDEAERESK